MTLFERVKEVSKKHGFSSLQTLSEAAGLSPNVIYGWKTKKPSAASLQAVADQLNVSVDYLLGNTDEMYPRANDDTPEHINLDEALRKQGVVMEFQGKELSDKAKRKILDILKIVDGDED
ncbi:helix-turn-helix domain-containing protein [Weissella sp. MSCH1]|uniref:helix-turn-helix domain-containing protein n=1 Tax=Weissella sp. MSCH1 TaxID=3383343 RepID=UPI003896E3B5